jgi:hypothetical protein
MFDINVNNSCKYQYRYSIGFDSCLYLHGESLRITLLVCTISIFALLITLLLMLITAKKLLPKLTKQEHGTTHSFLSKSDIVNDTNVQERDQSHLDSNKTSHQSFNIRESQPRSQQSDINS